MASVLGRGTRLEVGPGLGEQRRNGQRISKRKAEDCKVRGMGVGND